MAKAGKLTWGEVVGLADELQAALKAVADVIKVAKAVSGADTPAGKGLTSKEADKIRAAGDEAILKIHTLIDAVISEAGD